MAPHLDTRQPDPPPPEIRHLEIRHGDRELSGVVRADEAWLAAARRTAATVSSDPVPEDLSGDPLRWRIDHVHVVAVRAMTRGDLPDLTRWRQTDHVRRWWAADGEPTAEAIEAEFGPRIDGRTPTRMWVIEVNGRSIGFIQDYRLRDYPDFALLTPDPDAVGLDYAIGETAWLGRGFGARAIWSWLARARHRFPDVGTYFAAPDHRNKASLRMLEKAGFRQGVWFDEPRGDGAVDTVVGCTLDVARVLG